MKSTRQSPPLSTRTVSCPLVSVAACASSLIVDRGAGCGLQLELPACAVRPPLWWHDLHADHVRHAATRSARSAAAG